MQTLIGCFSLKPLNSLSIIKLQILALTILLLNACSSIPIGERDTARDDINLAVEKSISEYLKDKPDLQSTFDSSTGYFLGWVSGAKLPVLGGGIGSGILYDQKNKIRTYMDVSRLDFGLGLAAGRYQVLIIFEDEDSLVSFQESSWFTGVSTKSSVTTNTNTTRPLFAEGASFHMIGETGAALTVTAHVIKLSVNEDLTDTGMSDVSIPNRKFDITDKQTKDAPRQWEHTLPFFAQEVIDKGYNLPLPYSISLLYANIDQSFQLDSLDAGFNGGGKESLEFVDFQNATAKTQSVQLKVDVWLFPFMNVFAILGTLDGEAPVDIAIEGNSALDYLDKDCSSRPRPVSCRLLEDQLVGFHLDVPISGTTYSLGTTLVGGWSNYFVALPLSFTYSDMDGKNLTGYAFTATPRGGRVFNLNEMGSLAIFAGGNYLDADLSVTGTVSCQSTDLDCLADDPFSIDYTINQSNTDQWNMLIGGNWDFNKNWSWHAEYDGFIGSRDAFITSVSYRY